MTIDEALALGIAYQKGGRLAAAEHLYRSVLQANPGNLVAAFLLTQVSGALAAQSSGSEAQKQIPRVFEQAPAHHVAVPPCNLNWMLSDLSPVAEFLADNPIVVADIGARGGQLGEIENLRSYLAYYAFDADADECARLKSASSGFHSYEVLPYYVGKDDGPVEFNLYRSAGQSSRFLPNERFKSLFDPNIGVKHCVTVQGRRWM